MLKVNEKSTLESVGRGMYDLVSQLFPICRSVTGDGVRQTLSILGNHVPLIVHEIPTGTEVFDWVVPQEWNITDAYIKDGCGNRIVDFQESNLHVVGGSDPVKKTLPWRELKQHLISLPEHPDWVPFRTSFHRAGWAFCLSHRQLLELDGRGDQNYEVCIDATWEDGSLTYGELHLPGASHAEVLISTHVCHPSLANDNLSGIAVATFLAKYLQSIDRRYSYRFLFIPATIGAVTWLCLNESAVDNIRHGLILSVLGDAGPSTYRKSRRGDAEIDRAAVHVLKQSGREYTILDFEPFGYDQRQFCSPGFDLPVGCLMRTPNEAYPQYHTSADNLDLVRPEFLADSWSKCVALTEVLENNRTYLNRNPKCEPRLGKHGLYPPFGSAAHQDRLQRAVLWVLNLSDGLHALLDIAERSNLDFRIIRQAANSLLECGLIEELCDDDRPGNSSPTERAVTATI